MKVIKNNKLIKFFYLFLVELKYLLKLSKIDYWLYWMLIKLYLLIKGHWNKIANKLNIWEW